MKDFESLTEISDEYYCKVNPACFKCFKMVNSLEKNEKKIWKKTEFWKVIQK